MAIIKEAHAFNLALCAALGLDPTKVRAITIHSRAQKMVVVEVEQLLPLDDGDALLAQVKRYTLTAIEQEP
jgi:hypothetical protein